MDAHRTQVMMRKTKKARMAKKMATGDIYSLATLHGLQMLAWRVYRLENVAWLKATI